MKKTILSTVTALVLCIGQTPVAHAESAPVAPANIIISEIQTGGSNDATEEFVELYNPNNTSVDMRGWQLQYRAASGTHAQTWPVSTIKATISCSGVTSSGCTTIIAPLNRIVLVHTINNIAGALTMSGGFSGSGGEIRLVQPASADTPLVIEDFVGYGTAQDSEGLAADAPAAGKSIKRKITNDNLPIDTNNNAADFIADCGIPSPGIADTSPLPYTTGCAAPITITPPGTSSNDPGADDPAPTPPADENSEPDPPATEPEPPSQPTYLPLSITELLPNPAIPQQDTVDEFIELYNPNDTTVTLQSYRLQTGSDYRYSFTLGDTPLGPHMYLAIPSAVSKLSLVNSGSGVRLLDPNGKTAYEVANYGDAKEGQSWMIDTAGVWQWTLTPTPNAANVVTITAPKTSAASPATSAKTKQTTTPKITSQKTVVPKTVTPKKGAVATTPNSPASQPAAVAQAPQYWLLIPIGGIVGGYALYEYRQDIAKIARRCWQSTTKNKLQPGEEQ